MQRHISYMDKRIEWLQFDDNYNQEQQNKL